MQSRVSGWLVRAVGWTAVGQEVRFANNAVWVKIIPESKSCDSASLPRHHDSRGCTMRANPISEGVKGGVIGRATSDCVTGSMLGVTMAAMTKAATTASRHQRVNYLR